jgi:hypothetical protein
MMEVLPKKRAKRSFHLIVTELGTIIGCFSWLKEYPPPSYV